MFDYLRKVVSVFTQEPVRPEMSLSDRLLSRDLIETTNDCGEKRYIEVTKTEKGERRVTLEILLTKCKRLLSFVERTDDVQVFEKMAYFVVKVRQAKYRGDDIHGLIEEFEKIEKSAKKSSKSFKNLSHVMMMG